LFSRKYFIFDITIGKAYMNAVIALVGATLLISAVTVGSTVTRGWGFGMMDENETTPSKDNSPEALFSQNQANCLNLDDGWWSPIAGSIAVKACGPTGESSNLQALSKQTETSTTPPSTTETNTETQPTTETSTTLAPPDLTETEDKEGNTILSSIFKNVTVTAIAATQSIKEGIGIPEVSKQVCR
jgi:hypothetical protein